jgi:hypothetical protein
VASASPQSPHLLPPRSQEEGEEGIQEVEEEGLLTWHGHPDGWSRTALGLV